MPREFALVTAAPVDLPAIVTAAAAVDDTLVVRALASGQVLQLVDGDDEPVLTIQGSRLIERGDDIRRLSPVLAQGAGDGERYWSEAFAPWTPAGERASAIVGHLARALGGRWEGTEG
jgi:hypothetical protein